MKKHSLAVEKIIEFDIERAAWGIMEEINSGRMIINSVNPITGETYEIVNVSPWMLINLANLRILENCRKN